MQGERLLQLSYFVKPGIGLGSMHLTLSVPKCMQISKWLNRFLNVEGATHSTGRS